MSTNAFSRREFLRAAAAAGLTTAVGSDVLAAATTQRRRPNIVLILADDLGYECAGADGGDYRTPALDKLAAGGLRFQNCHSQPLCTPSRVQMMTGIYNVRNYVRFGYMAPDERTFSQLLKRAGYATCVVGKWQLEGGLEAPHRFGFDEYCLWQLNRRPGRYPNPGLEVNGRQVDYTHGQYGPDLVSDYACDFIGRNRDKPFLLYYPMILPHDPFEPTPDSADWDPTSKGAAKGGDPKYFPDMVAYVDKLVGKIVRRLDALGLRDNTLILFSGDNGTGRKVTSRLHGRTYTGGKGLTTDAGTHVPLIVNWSGTTPKGGICADLVDFTDFFPTLCGAAGVTVPTELNIDGRSFLPQLQGKRGTPREWIYCWFSREGDIGRAREFARDHRFKLYRTGEFYDLTLDPEETAPLMGSRTTGEAAQAKKALQRVLDRYANARPERLRSTPGPASATQTVPES
jgi:arylsulfatase A